MKLINLLKYTTLLFLFSVQLTFASKYYVNAINGNDNNTGLSPRSALNSIFNIYSFILKGGTMND